MKIVVPVSIGGNGWWNHLTGRKKWRITCGACAHCWYEKVPIRESCSAVCPCCGAQNVWSASSFESAYNRSIEP